MYCVGIKISASIILIKLPFVNKKYFVLTAKILQKFNPFKNNYFLKFSTIFFVSRAMINPSLVGTTNTLTFEE